MFSWTGMLAVPWSAALGSLVGTLAGLGIATGWAIDHHLVDLGAGQSVSLVGVASGFFLGLVGGALFAVAGPLANPVADVVSIASGALLSIVLVALIAAFERASLRVRGYRRLSRQEVRRIAPLVKSVAEAMELDGLPRFSMSDEAMPNAWTHMRTIVLTTGLLQMLDDDELTGVLAHELHHWRSGDAVGLRLVWTAALPIALLLDVGSWIAGGSGVAAQKRDDSSSQRTARPRGGFIAFVGWVIAWAPWVITKFILAPVAAATQRRYEYEADAAAAAIGLSTALSSALRKMGAFEAGRAGWERAIVATHPPTELRLEALERPRSDDAAYQEQSFGLPSLTELLRILRSLI
ncbi:MAG TPA: M48 family metalloprotease [Acidimicrobiales bacterium]|nr:M48 family metalloprotease [Acidimicrobiales bacterium]